MLTSIEEESSRYGVDPRFGEVSRFNANAIRGPNGIWNEETLPVLEWEAAEYRIVLPLDLQMGLELEQPTLRWEADKRLRAYTKHPTLASIDFTDAGFWAHWERFGPEPTKRISWNVFFSRGGYEYIAILSHHHGELTFTTVFSPRPEWLEERLRAGAGRWLFRQAQEKE
jgi:hypothetical protein